MARLKRPPTTSIKIDARLDEALMNILMYLPDQVCRCLASDARLAGSVSYADLRKMVRVADRLDWYLVRETEYLRELARDGKATARRR